MSPRHEHYADILTTAVEGGSDYWASFRKYVSGEGEGDSPASVEVRDAHGDYPEWKVVTVALIGSALSRMSRGGGYSTSAPPSATPEWWTKKWALAYRECADGEWDFDADDADCILQVAAFGEVVYG